MAEVTASDPGLQPQRTALAWSRTGLSVFVNGLIVLRAGSGAQQRFVVALGIVLLLASATTVACGVWRVLHLGKHGARAAPPWALIVAAVWVAWLACFAGVATIVATSP
jgi:hypothetical protein